MIGIKLIKRKEDGLETGDYVGAHITVQQKQDTNAQELAFTRDPSKAQSQNSINHAKTFSQTLTVKYQPF